MKKVKLIVLGESGVGKTSIMEQYFEKKYNEEYKLRSGMDKGIKYFSIKGKKFHIEFWDTQGQEIFRAVNKLYMKNAQIALIVYSIIDKNSFEQLNFWINLVKEVNKDKKIIFGIAANKSDLFESQIVSFEEGKKFADENDCLFFETSAKDHKSIENLFQKLAEKYAECNLNEKVEIKSLETTDNNNQISGNENDKNNEMFQQNENENIIINKDDDDKTCSSRC
jgi:small GTP-binding protein